jgi:MATE family multidrug resistance protein
MSNSQTTHLYPSREPALANLLRIAAPLGGAMLSQAVVGLVDTALVGHLGGLALASVSIGSYLVFILVAIITGFGTGWHGLVSQHAQCHKGLLELGLVYGLFISVGLGLTGAYVAEDVINLFVLDDRINSLAAYYGQSRLWALPAIVISIAARIYWSERGTAWQYTKIILLAHLANIPISYGLIYGIAGLPAMGAVGAGVGTSIALWFGVLLQLILLFRSGHHNVSDLGGGWQLSLKNWPLLLRFTWPPMLQQLAFALHLAVFFWILSQLGASVLAASFAVLNVGLLLILPAIGLGQAALSLIGPAVANKDTAQAIRWSKLIMRTGLFTALVLMVCVGFMSQCLAQLLLVNRELQQLMATALPWYAIAMVLETIIIILSRFMLLAGLRKTALILVSASQWLLFLPLLAWLAPSYGFMSVWWLHIGYRMLGVLLLWLVWRRYINGLPISRKFSVIKE